ncbi:Hypothetical predicted protein [Marmota monax]|uniref:Uncharacterized protein n=1 Tax=Marmota monax TaxID=9995 RepID=A0A5E4D7Z4_MARMO|nr:Hypothetical predicted protein [Marmota monax]
MEDEERRRKVEAGKAKLAQFRQRRARLDGQNPHKKPKKKKTSSSKNDVHGLNIDQPKSEEMLINSSQGVGSAVMPESTIMRTLNNEEMLKHEQVFSFDPKSEISTTADDNTSENYLNVIHGVVDSEDLPLNISQENAPAEQNLESHSQRHC